MADLGINAKPTPDRLEFLRAKSRYSSHLARLAQIEVTREEHNMSLATLAEEEISLKAQVADFETKYPKQ